jgi:hypothetical protein
MCERCAYDNDVTSTLFYSLCTAFKSRALIGLHIPTLYLGNNALKFASDHLDVIINADCRPTDDDDISRVVITLYSSSNHIG